MITAEYLNEQVASLERQQANALATYNAAGGAIEAYRHLLTKLAENPETGDKDGNPDRVD